MCICRFFLTCGKFAGDLSGDVRGGGPLKGEKRRKEAIERGLPGDPKCVHLAVPLTGFVHEFQAFCYLLL